jgi:hypothetical protein
MVSWEDVPHLTEAQKAAILASIPLWQRGARTKGTPQLGAGAIYQVPEDDILVDPFPIPHHWKRSYGMDVGWNRTAAIWTAQDPETGGVVAYDEHYRGQAEPSVHASAVQGRGKWIPGAIDPAARGRSQKDGEQLLVLYRQLGLDIEVAINSVEAGISTVWEMLSTGQLKLFRTLTNTRSEMRLYRRDEQGRVVKENDHLMDALRYNIMSGLARAIVEPLPRSDGMPWFHWSPPPVWSG